MNNWKTISKHVKVSFTVDFDENLQDAFIKFLKDTEAGSVKEDRGWAKKQIARAEAMNPDRNELALFIAMRAGFGSFTQNPVTASFYSEAVEN